MSFLKSLSDMVSALIQHKADEATITRADITETCNEILAAQNNIREILQVVGKPERSAMLTAMKGSKIPAAVAYQTYVKALASRKSTNYEAEAFFGSLEKANKTMLGLIADILKNVDQLIDDKNITIHNTRITHAATLGILSHANLLTTFTAYLLDAACGVVVEDTKRLPKYREVYLTKNALAVARVVDLINDREGRYNFVKEMDGLKRRGDDLMLWTERGTIDEYGSDRPYEDAKGFIMGFLDVTIPFYAVRKFWDDYKHNQYLKNRNTKAWLEQRVALVRYKLAGMDPNSPEYIKAEEVAANYDELISKYDRKIQDYMDR